MTASVIKIKFLNIYKYINIITVIKGKKYKKVLQRGGICIFMRKLLNCNFMRKMQMKHLYFH